MGKNGSESDFQKILDRIQSDIRLIQLSCPDIETKEKLNKLLEYIELETAGDRASLIDSILLRAKQTKGMYPELNINFYLLFRKLSEYQVSVQEAQNLYDMYDREYKIKSKGLG